MTPELDWLKRWSMYAPSSVALQSGEDGRAWTYAELFARACRVARVLRTRFGVNAGDRVACVAQNDLDYVVLFFAVARLGAILVPVNFRFTASEVGHIVRDADASLVIVDEDLRGGLAEAFGPSVQTWGFDGPDSLVSVSDDHSAAESDLSAEFSARSEDPAMILYTSGTTGRPKGAVISHRMIFWNSLNTGLRLNLTQNEVVLTFLPLFHTGGWNVLTTPCLHRGARVILLKRFDAGRVLDICAREKVSVLFGVPTTMDLLRREPGFATVDLTSVRYAVVGGEPMSLEAITAWEERGIPIRQGYGLTEFGPSVFSLNEQDSRRKMGSIGFPNFYVDTRVVKEDGSEAGIDEIGELWLSGPSMMSGYWRNDAATAETLRDGWLRTGDLVRRDAENYHYVVGRKKEMFISGGENVYPAEVERVIGGMPGIREVAVIGVPHVKWGECGKAYVTFEEDRSHSVEEIRDHCLANLAKFKVPAQFVVLKELPKNENGKIAKRQLTV